MRENLVQASLLASGGLLAIFGVPRLVFLGCHSITPISAFLFTWCSPCVRVCLQIYFSYKKTSPTGLGPHPTPIWLHPNWLHFKWPCFQMISHSNILRVRNSPYEFSGDTIQPLTQSNSNNIYESLVRSYKIEDCVCHKLPHHKAPSNVLWCSTQPELGLAQLRQLGERC